MTRDKCYPLPMSLFVVYLSTQEQPKILRALKAVPEEDRFEFIVEAGENVVLPKSDIICWEEYAEGQTAAILSREAMLAKRALAMRHDEEEEL
jgi:hypothetical protein